MNFLPNIPKAIIPILVINFISTLSFSIVLPFLFILVDDYGGNAFIYGILGATYSVFQLIGSPLLGTWSDKLGRRPILLLSQFGTLVAWIIFLISFYLGEASIIDINNPLLGAFVLTLPLMALFFARALDGITGGNVSVANAYLVDVSTKEDRTKNFGYMSVSASLGFVIGPALAGLLGNTSLGLVLPVMSAILISAIALLLIIFLLKPEEKEEKIEPEKITTTKKSSFRDVLAIPHIKLLLLMNFIIFLGFNFFYISFPVFIILEIGWNEFELGLLLTFLSLCMVLVQGPILSRLSDKTSTNNLMIVGSVILAVGFAIVTLEATIYLYIAMVLVAVGNGVLYPSLIATISNHAGEEHQGATQGYAASSGSLASIMGLIIGGVLYNLLKSTLFIFSAVTIFVLAFMALRLRIVEKEHKLDSQSVDKLIKTSKPVVVNCDPMTVPKKFVSHSDLEEGSIS
ncbi:MAG: Tetracycline resistance protein, class C [Candidatus Heimdallarchaeota archaeon LC_3]|nr:MAG: Tetracycline resistance protein, class C [Candidatus Heimdallarchaeota archaeon LC_3]